MTIFYSPENRGFYDDRIHAVIPTDAVEITAEDHAALISGQSSGRQIVPGQDGAPVLAEITAPTEAELLAARRAAMVVSRFQARAALLGAGLLDAANAAVAAADQIVQIAWADAVEFRRTSPTIAALGAALELTEAQIDDLFDAAALITA